MTLLSLRSENRLLRLRMPGRIYLALWRCTVSLAQSVQVQIASQKAMHLFLSFWCVNQALIFCGLRNFVAQQRGHCIQLLLRIAMGQACAAALRVRSMALGIRRACGVPLCSD